MNTVAIVHENRVPWETYHLCGDCGMWVIVTRVERHKCWSDGDSKSKFPLLEQALEWASNLPTDNVAAYGWVLDQLSPLSIPAFVVSRLY